MAIARTIIEELTVGELVDEVTQRFPRFEYVWESWKWRLSRDPITDSMLLNEVGGVRLIRSDPNYEQYQAPSVTILYKHNDDVVSILSVVIHEPT